MVEVVTIGVVTIEVVTIEVVTIRLIKGPIRGLTGHGRGDDLQRLEHHASTLQIVSLQQTVEHLTGWLISAIK